MAFFKELSAKNEKLNSKLCVGIDPHLRLLDDFLKQELVVHGEKKFLLMFGAAHIHAAKGVASTIKIQSSFYESFGVAGLSALKDTISLAKSEGLLVILDAKRGDIASTMAAYGEASFDHLGADCLTVSPYLGIDVIASLLPWLKKGKGVYIVWNTSNTGAGDLQDLLLWDGRKVYEAVFEQIQHWLDHEKVSASVGWVLGATRVDELRPHFLDSLKGESFLLPGFGAQGAKLSERVRLFLHDKSIHSLVPISRGLSFGPDNKSLRNWDEYEGLIRKRLLSYRDLIKK